jgi:predicted O-methyltransferase YrrM
MILFGALKYLKYILFSKHWKGHGIHSPFIFDLISRVFRNKIDHDIVCKIERTRKKMISDQRSLIVKDFGSGSEKSKASNKKVSTIARYSPVPKKYGVLLANLASEFGGSYMIEFGTSFGISTMYMAGGKQDAIVYTMEGSEAISEIAHDNFKANSLNNIMLLTGSFEELLPSIQRISGKPGLIFIDGNHRRDPLIDYFSRMIEISDNNTVMVIDDIHYSKEMEEAWDMIKKHERVTITVDICRMGLIFFREGLVPFDYIVRY